MLEASKNVGADAFGPRKIAANDRELGKAVVGGNGSFITFTSTPGKYGLRFENQTFSFRQTGREGFYHFDRVPAEVWMLGSALPLINELRSGY